MHRSSTLPLYSVFYLHGGIFWDVFHAVHLVFSSEVFWRGFFPWACWPHVLNKSVFMLAHPSYLNVCFCVVHLVVFIFALLCTDSRFLHVAQSSLVPRPCAFVACSTKFSANFVLQARNAQGLGTRLAQSPRFLHVAQSLSLKCNGLSVRCMQSEMSHLLCDPSLITPFHAC